MKTRTFWNAPLPARHIESDKLSRPYALAGGVGKRKPTGFELEASPVADAEGVTERYNRRE